MSRNSALDSINLDDTDDFQSSRGSSFRVRKAAVLPKKRRLGRRAKVDSSGKSEASISKHVSAKSRVGRRDGAEATSASSGPEIELERVKRCSSGRSTCSSKESTSTESVTKYPKAKSQFEDLKSGETTQSEDVTDTGTCFESEETNVQPGKVVVEKLTGLSPEKSYVVKGQWILESHWLKEQPDATTSESRSQDEWSEVVGTSETTDGATSDATVRASDLTSPESRDDGSDVTFISRNDARDMRVDVQDDLIIAKKLAQREGEKLMEEQMTDEAVAVCQVCQKDISHMNSQRRLQHVNKCLDEQIDLEEQRQAEEAAAQRLQNAVLPCPMCDAKFKQPQAKKNHVKTCAKKKKVTPQELRVMLRKQEQEYLEKLVDGELPAVPERPKKKKVAAKKKEPKVLKEPASKYEEDMQVTLALSKSLVEFSAVPIKPAVSVVAQKTAKGKRNMGPSKVPLLVARGSEERRRIIEEGVFALIPDETSLFPELVTLKPSRIIEEDWDDAIQIVRGYSGRSIWAKCCATPEDILEEYYVPCLMPPISPCKVTVGSKIRRMSQVPGRKKSLASQAAVNLVERASPEKMDVVCLDSSRVFDEEGLLDVSERIQATGFCTSAKDDESHQEAKTFDETSSSCHDNLILDFKKMIGNPQLSDVSILCKNVEYVPAHKFIFAARCPKLLKEVKREKIIEFVDVSKAAIFVLLTFLYTGEILDLDLDSDDVISNVGTLSERFNLYVLTDECKRKGWTSAASEVTSAPGLVAMEMEELLKNLWEDDEEENENDDTADDREKENITMNEEDVEEIYEFMTQKKQSQKRTNQSVEDHGIVDYNVYFDDPSEMRESLVNDDLSRQELVVDTVVNAVNKGGKIVQNEHDTVQVDFENVTSGGVTVKIVDATKSNRTPNAKNKIASLRIENAALKSDFVCSGVEINKLDSGADEDKLGTAREIDTGGSDVKIVECVKTAGSNKQMLKNGVSTVLVDEFLFEDHGSDDADKDLTDIEIDEDIWSFTEVSPSKRPEGLQLAAEVVNGSDDANGVESGGDCKSDTCISDSESVRDCGENVDVGKVQVEIDRLLQDRLRRDDGSVACLQDGEEGSTSWSQLSDTSDGEEVVSGERNLDKRRQDVDKLKKSMEDLDRESIIALKKRLEEKCSVAWSNLMEWEKMGIVRRPSKGFSSGEDSTDGATEPGTEECVKSASDMRVQELETKGKIQVSAGVSKGYSSGSDSLRSVDSADFVQEENRTVKNHKQRKENGETVTKVGEGFSSGGDEARSVGLVDLVRKENRTARNRRGQREKAQTVPKVGEGFSSGGDEARSVGLVDLVREENRTASNRRGQREKAQTVTRVGEGFSSGGDEPKSVNSADFVPDENKRTANNLSRPEFVRVKKFPASNKGYSSAGDVPSHINTKRTIAEKNKKSISDSEEATKCADLRQESSSVGNEKLNSGSGANSKLTEHDKLGIHKQRVLPSRHFAQASGSSPKSKDDGRHVEVLGRQGKSPKGKITDSIKDGARVNSPGQLLPEKKGKSFRSMCSNMAIGSDGVLKARHVSPKNMSRTASDEAGVGEDVSEKDRPETGKNLSPKNRRQAEDVRITDRQDQDPSFALPRSPVKKMRKSSLGVINDERISRKLPGLRNPGSPVVKLRKLSPRSLDLSGISEISRRDSDVVRFTPGREASTSWHQSSTPRTSTVRDYSKDDSLFLSPVCKDQRSTFQIVTPQTDIPKKKTDTETSTRLKSQKTVEKIDAELETGDIVKTQPPPALDIDTPTQSFVEGASSASLFDTSAPDKRTLSPRFEKVYHSPVSKLGDVRNYTNLSDSDEEERTSSLRLALHLVVAESPTAHIQCDVNEIDTTPSSPLFPAAPKMGYSKSPLKKSSPRKKSTSLFTLLDSPKVLSYNSLRPSPVPQKDLKHGIPSPKKRYDSPSDKAAQVLKRKRLQSYETDAGRLKRTRHGKMDSRDGEELEIVDVDSESPTHADQDAGKFDGDANATDHENVLRVKSPRSSYPGEKRDRSLRKVAKDISRSKKLSSQLQAREEMVQELRKSPIVVEILDSDEELEADGFGVQPEDHPSRRSDDYSMTDGGKEENLGEFDSNRTCGSRSKGKIGEMDARDFSKRSESFHNVSIPDACDDDFQSGQSSGGHHSASEHRSREGGAFHDVSIPDAYDDDILVPSPGFNQPHLTPRKRQSFRDDSDAAGGENSLLRSPRRSQPRPSPSRVMSPDMFDDDEEDILTGGPEITVLSDDSCEEEEENHKAKSNKKSGNQPHSGEGHNDTLIALLDDGSFEEEPSVREDARMKTPSTRRNWAAPSPFTPMPDYDNMKTPQLKQALAKIGVRPQGKKKGIKLLKHVYEETHQYETDPDYTPAGHATKKQGVVIVKENIRRVVTFEKDEEDDRLFGDLEVPLMSRLGMGPGSRGRGEAGGLHITKRRAVHEMSDSESELDCSFGSSSTSSETASDVSLTDEGDLTLSQQEDNKSMKEKLLSFIRRDKDLYTMVLKYQPIEFTWLVNKLKDGGLTCPASKLMDILDEQCIVFKAQRPVRKGQKPRQRKTKKVMASSSPRKIPSPKKGRR
ncbi:uncharacterized protein LOC135493508 [Lineus longissimus]|uniref:uncharacterized protein LOC135493508 n=1 Tax=Lineus longissimus TaxID=88925 RepID=UPI002B4C863F